MDFKNFRSSSLIQPQKKASTSVTSKSTQTLSTQTTLPPSSAFKKLTVSGIREFVPQPTNQTRTPRFSGGNTSEMRLPTNSTTPPYTPSNFGGSDRLNPNAALLQNSPSQSPTPALGMMGSATEASSASNIAVYNEGGTTYFYSGDEMVCIALNLFQLSQER